MSDHVSLKKLREAVDQTAVGKKTGYAFYVHVSALDLLPEYLRAVEWRARVALSLREMENTNLIKFPFKKRAVSYLSYPDFDSDPHPRLRRSVYVNMEVGQEGRTTRTYNWRKNPPILHRKELFVGPDYPNRDVFKRLTEQEEAAEMLGGGQIGLRKFWVKLLRTMNLRIQDHKLVSR